MARGTDAWLFDGDPVSPDEASALEATLSAGERARAARFVFERDRRRYILAHGFLRRVLGRTLDLAPERVALIQEPNAKPRIQGEDLAFSLSHSGPFVLVAVRPQEPLGADIEAPRPLDLHALAARVCAPRERAWLDAQPDAERAFLHLWTGKEAVLKARGTGLSQDPREVGIDVGEGRADGMALWFAATDRYVCALARDAPDEVRVWSAAALG